VIDHNPNARGIQLLLKARLSEKLRREHDRDSGLAAEKSRNLVDSRLTALERILV